MSETHRVLIIGAGGMARAYASVLKSMKVDFEAVARSASSARSFSEETGAACRHGGIAAISESLDTVATEIIVAVSVDETASVVEDIVRRGAKRLLVEKPGGLVPEDLERNAALAKRKGAEVYIAYNRRFYESVRYVRRAVDEDGGVVSFAFEFTEVSDRVLQSGAAPAVMANWGLANSTHVIDTAFFIAGAPATIAGARGGHLPWHPPGSRFIGHGVAITGAPFTYFADWDAPGRWGIEVNTIKRKFVLRPMETLQVQRRGTFSLEAIKLDDDVDRAFKPGLYHQTNAFIHGVDQKSLIDIGRHAINLSFVQQQMLGAPEIIPAVGKAQHLAAW